MNDQAIETDERDVLSACHRDYMVRYVEFELERQERVSKSFLQERFKRLPCQAEKSMLEASEARLRASCAVLVGF
jgi:hypothetical protein